MPAHDAHSVHAGLGLGGSGGFGRKHFVFPGDYVVGIDQTEGAAGCCWSESHDMADEQPHDDDQLFVPDPMMMMMMMMTMMDAVHDKLAYFASAAFVVLVSHLSR